MTNDQRQAAGGSAFPHPECSDKGLTIRDYFAAAALTGLLSFSPGESCEEQMEFGDAATDAYAYADAMLQARRMAPAKQD